MPTPRLPDALAQQALDSWFRHGRSRKGAAAELGIPETTFENRLNTARARGLKPRVRVLADSARRPEPIAPVARDAVRVLVIPDAHDCPELPKDRFRWIGRFARDEAPDRIVSIGDFADLESLCSHVPNESFAGKLKPTYLADIASMNEAIGVMHDAMGGFACPIDKTIGNHEKRLYDFQDRTPETFGMMQEEYEAVLRRYGWRWHPFGKMLDIGGVWFTHVPLNVMGRPMGGLAAAATIGRQSTQDIVFGHTHRAAVGSTPKVGERGVRAFEIGCALPPGHRQAYAKHTQGAWWHGVVLLTIRDGGVAGWQFVPMEDLQRRYG